MTSQQSKKKSIPDVPGVYVFRDGRQRPLYIGRATSLRDRVKSYFKADLITTRGPRLVDMVTKSKHITWQVTGSVLEAIILESSLIKKYQPYYNIAEKDDRSAEYVIVTDEPWPRVFLERARDFEHHRDQKTLPYGVKKVFGPFQQAGVIKEALNIIRGMFPFKDKKAHDPRHQAFYESIGRSPVNNSDALTEYSRTIKWLIMFFDGRRTSLRRDLNRSMREYAGKLMFEDARRIRNLLYALDHINDIALIKRERNISAKLMTIEAYDVAHLMGTGTVGVMVASIGGRFERHLYRKFNIKHRGVNDLAGLIEIVSRRLNHPEWPFPDLIVVDGNEVQKKGAEAVLSSRRMSIPVVAVVKNERHKPDKLLGSPDIIKRYKDDIIALNAEAHRFAVSFHRQQRQRAYQV